MAQSGNNQNDRQAYARGVSGTTLNYEGDWHAMFNVAGIADGGRSFNERLLLWINQQLSSSYTELNGAMQAFARSQGANSWNEWAGFAFFTGASLDLGFAGGNYFGSNPSLLTVVRAQVSTSYAETVGGVLMPFNANVARITDKGMLIEESRQNLAVRSQEFDNASWAKANTTVSADATAAPDGTVLADAIIDDNTNTSHNLSVSIGTTSTIAYTFSVYAKAGTDNRIQLTFSGTPFTGVPFANFNLSTGTMTQLGAGNSSSASIQALANGWYRCILTATSDVAAAGAAFIVRINSDTSARSAAYIGSSTTIFVWGAQVENPPASSLFLASSYIPTAAGTVTRNADQIQLTSTAFSSVWGGSIGSMYAEFIPANNSASSLSRRLLSASDGTATNNIELAQTTANFLNGGMKTTSQQYTLSPSQQSTGTVNRVMTAWSAALTSNVSANGLISTPTGTVTTATLNVLNFGSEISYAANAFLNGYLRRVALWTTRQTDAAMQAFTAFNTDLSLDMFFATGSYVGASSGDLTTVRAQTVTSYAQTVAGVLTPFAANVPRITDLGILIEDTRTNIVVRSQEFDNASWVKTNCTITADSTAAPDGTTTADTIIDDATSGFHGLASATWAASNTLTYTLSCYVKAGTDTRVQLITNTGAFTNGPYANFDLSAGTVTATGGSTNFVNASIQALANGWYRCIMTVTPDVTTNATVSIGRIAGAASTRAQGYVGSGTTIFAWGYQVEALPATTFNFASSYIPTTTVSVARPTDMVSLAGSKFLSIWSNVAGTIIAEGVVTSNTGGGASRRLAEVSDGTGSNRYVAAINNAGNGRFLVANAAITQCDVNGGTMPTGGNTRIACAFATNDAIQATNAGLQTLDTSFAPPLNQTTLQIGAEVSGIGNTVWNNYIRRIQVYRTRLTDAQLVAATMLGGASLDINFTSSAYYGAASTDLVTSRATPPLAYEDTTAGSWTSFAPNILRVTNKGTLQEEARTNSIRNNSMTGAVISGASPTNWLFGGAVGLTRTVTNVFTQNGIDFVTFRYNGTTSDSAAEIRFETTTQIAANNTTLNLWNVSFFAGVTDVIGNLTANRTELLERDAGGAALASQFGAAILTSTTTLPITTRYNTTYTVGNASTAFVIPGFSFTYPSGQAVDFSITLGWPQCEQLAAATASATSPIRTTNATVTRAIDVVTMTGVSFSNWYVNAAAGTLYWEGIYPQDNAANRMLVDISSGATANELLIQAATGGVLNFTARDTSVAQATISTGATLTVGQTIKAAAAWTLNDFVFYVNGTQVGTDAAGTIPAVSQLNLGSRVLGTSPGDAYTRRLVYAPGRLTNAQLASMTT